MTLHEHALAAAALCLPFFSESPHLGSTAGLYGHAIALLRPANGQALPRLAIGAPGFFACEVCTGYVEFTGDKEDRLRVAGGASGDRFGFALASFRAEAGQNAMAVLVGAPQAGIAGGPVGSGYVAAIFSPNEGIAWTIAGHDQGDEYGFALCTTQMSDSKPARWAIIGAPQSQSAARGTAAGRGFVEAVDLAKQERTWKRIGLQLNSRYGYAVASIDDVDADGTPEVVVGSPTHVTSGIPCGRVEALNGVSGNQLWELSGVPSIRGLGRAFCLIGDRDRDGLRDIAVCASTIGLIQPDSTQDAVAIISGRSGKVLDIIRSPLDRARGFGLAMEYVSAAADTRDSELWIGAPFSSQPALMMGDAGLIQAFAAEGEPKRIFELGSPYLKEVSPGSARGPAHFGSSIAQVGDVDGDGVADLAVSAPDPLSVECVFILSGKNGAVLRIYSGEDG